MLLLSGCANRGNGPQGGAKDETPPVPLKTIPANGTVNYGKKRVEILFDEIVTVTNAYEAVVVSPPQIKPAIIKAYGRRVTVELIDTLKKETTYTIDFADAIADNNEGNILKSYTFSFATDTIIDTLKMSGLLLDAETLNPLSKVMIGIHSDLSDSAFLKKPFDRITKTDANGFFTVSNIRAGSYRIYALDDIGGNYRFDQPNELIAFTDSIFVPQVFSNVHSDTLWRDSVVIADSHADTLRLVDSIATVVHSVYQPDRILLQGFSQTFFRQYLIRSERKLPHCFALYFNEAMDTLPVIQALNFPFDSAVLVQLSATRDSLCYWLTDTLAWQTDTLSFVMNYYKTDSTNALVLQTDTLHLRTTGVKKPAPNESRAARNRREKEAQKMNFLKIGNNLSASFDLYRPVELHFETPTNIANPAQIVIEQKVDTLWKPLSVVLERGDSIGLRYLIRHQWKPETAYRLSVDSATCMDLYGHHNDKFSMQFTIKSLEQYATLIFEIVNYTGREVVQILDMNDKVIRTQRAETPFVKVEYLDPGDYYARLYIDDNGNTLWDPGDYSAHLQAEAVYYFPAKITLRAFWDVEEYWDYLEVPLWEQKPVELIKKKEQKK
jgi:hypothetical protein